MWDLTKEDFPSLREIKLRGSDAEPSSWTTWGFPWKQLTSITLANLADLWEDHLSVLNRCSSLEYLEMDVTNEKINCSEWGAVDEDLGDGEFCVLPQLKAFKIRVTAPCNIARKFLERLKVPSLDSFAFITTVSRSRSYWGGRWEEDKQQSGDVSDESEEKYTRDCPAALCSNLLWSFSSLIQQSECHLHRLELNLSNPEAAFDWLEFYSFLKRVPKLQSLSLTAPKMAFLFMLSPPHSLGRLEVNMLIPHPDNSFEEDLEKWVQGRKERKERLSGITGLSQNGAAWNPLQIKITREIAFKECKTWEL
ncbi:hypothetical protein EST38_g3206 [Candolleomyces aberdarensis]|uniref:FBD domain-containing protein n=1 Tax=Candolleomyces aberdarensis TaxID=2316362 RepID=A0A4V1Q4M9_9AGAR|nr:hypothetical protein EST38_g3206 [Candolleomyces aberdarensis]